MSGIEVSAGGGVRVTGTSRRLTYLPRRVTVDDGTWIAHESRGGTLNSVWFTDLGARFVEVVHLGHGPEGGELVLVVPDADVLAIGDLYTRSDPLLVGREWPPAVDLLLGMARESTRILTTDGEISRDQLEDFHQRLLGLWHG